MMSVRHLSGLFSLPIYSISYQHDGSEVPDADFDENYQLFSKVVREWGGWRETLRLLSQGIQDRSDFDGITFQPAVFAAAVKHMKKAKEKRTPKLLGVV